MILRSQLLSLFLGLSSLAAWCQETSQAPLSPMSLETYPASELLDLMTCRIGEQEAVVMSNPEAWEMLAARYRTGDGVPKNWEFAQEILDRLAWEQRVASRKSRRGEHPRLTRLKNGSGRCEDFPEALEDMRKLLERDEWRDYLTLMAGCRSPEAQFELGNLLPRDGKGELSSESLTWIRRAAEAGLPAAMTRLGHAILTRSKGDASKLREGFDWIVKGEGEAAAWLALGMMSPLNPDKALRHFRKAAVLGNTAGLIAMARESLWKGGSYSTKESEATALSWLQEARSHGSIEALGWMSLIHMQGAAAHRQPALAIEEALACLSQSPHWPPNDGTTFAAETLIRAYSRGEGVTRSLPKAMDLWLEWGQPNLSRSGLDGSFDSIVRQAHSEGWEQGCLFLAEMWGIDSDQEAESQALLQCALSHPSTRARACYLRGSQISSNFAELTLSKEVTEAVELLWEAWTNGVQEAQEPLLSLLLNIPLEEKGASNRSFVESLFQRLRRHGDQKTERAYGYWLERNGEIQEGLKVLRAANVPFLQRSIVEARALLLNPSSPIDVQRALDILRMQENRDNLSALMLLRDLFLSGKVIQADPIRSRYYDLLCQINQPGEGMD